MQSLLIQPMLQICSRRFNHLQNYFSWFSLIHKEKNYKQISRHCLFKERALKGMSTQGDNWPFVGIQTYVCIMVGWFQKHIGVDNQWICQQPLYSTQHSYTVHSLNTEYTAISLQSYLQLLWDSDRAEVDPDLSETRFTVEIKLQSDPDYNGDSDYHNTVGT